MKKYFRIQALIIGISMCLSACNADYESVPLDKADINYIFNPNDPTGAMAVSFLSGVYSKILDREEIYGVSIEASTPNAIASNVTNTPINQFAFQGYTPTSNPEDKWKQCYEGIRRANIFMTYYNQVPWSSAELKKWYGAEARFLRAYFYYELLKRYGGAVLVGDKPLSIEDNLILPNSSFEVVASYILSELRDIIENELLRPEADIELRRKYDDPDGGRITQGTAKMLKLSVQMLAASELYNEDYDVTRWEDAAATALDIIESEAYELEPKYTDLFTNRVGREIIFFYAGSNAKNNTMEKNLAPIGYNNAGNQPSEGRLSPTQELVDCFPMKDGKAINEAGKYTYDEENTPYLNRDPRLTEFIFYNGSRWCKRNVETFEGGKDVNTNTSVQQTRTSYYQRKFCGDYAEAAQSGNHYNNRIIFRYAEVLLDYAEAANEANLSIDDIFDKALIPLRKRAGIEPGSDNLYGLTKSISRDDLRKLIRNERRIELCFEGQYFWDLRRWKEAEIVYNKPVHRMKITKNGSGFYHKRFIVDSPVHYFEAPKMYQYPFPQSEMLKNPVMRQSNCYWGN